MTYQITEQPEARYQATIEQLLGLYRYRFYHTHDSRRSVPGFPDLIALRSKRGLAIEGKAGRRGLEPEQGPWLEDFDGALFSSHVWRPSTPILDIVRVLKGTN